MIIHVNCFNEKRFQIRKRTWKSLSNRCKVILNRLKTIIVDLFQDAYQKYTLKTDLLKSLYCFLDIYIYRYNQINYKIFFNKFRVLKLKNLT